MTYGPLSRIRVDQKGCASSLFQASIHEVCGSWWVVLSVTTHPFDSLPLIHSQVEGPHCASLYPLVVTDIYLIRGLTTGPHRASICPMVSSGLPLLFKNIKGPP